MTEARKVPAVRLPGGAAMPMVGFGTWPMHAHQACEAVLRALQAGYRHVDTGPRWATRCATAACRGRRSS